MTVDTIRVPNALLAQLHRVSALARAARLARAIGLGAAFLVLEHAGAARAELVIVQLKAGGELRGELLEVVPGRYIVVHLGSKGPTRVPKSEITWVYRDVPPVQIRDPFNPEFVIVELKGGRKLKGELIELVPGKHITIDPGDGRELRIAKQRIHWVQRRVDPSVLRDTADEQVLRTEVAGASGVQERASAPSITEGSDVSSKAREPEEPRRAAGAGTARSESDEALARRAFAAGRDAFGEKRFGDALTQFELAYRLSARPELLYNIGLAADAEVLAEKAIWGYAEYLRARPHSSLRESIEQRINALRLSHSDPK